ncbi:hypothetical protein ACFVT1_15025 [Streptomyces sp. NPDC057963]|uniref:hypothetical protein n=1 Tax=Streptomyces sp. NPDC057963 TaxID=3346290 RepID=UPI0036E83765
MDADNADTRANQQTAMLDGGPAHGLRMRVTSPPPVLQVTWPCDVEGPPEGMRVDALFVYRLDPRSKGEPLLRYGFDGASP